ncbi:hypothetical protein A5N16_00775 [Arthrobacter sp. M6]|nr:hypothetical protein [Arthrobacter sp. M5]NKR14320.1 hypothetical protein [Arthrobacter sp. M6]
MSIEHLIEQGHLHRETAGKHRGQWDRFEEIPNGRNGPAVESQVTTFITMFGGRLEHAAITYLCTAAELNLTPEELSRLQLISGSEFRADAELATRRTIDIVVVDRNDDLPASRGRNHFRPVVGVEGKYGAWVNGGNGFCAHTSEEDRRPDGYLPYSNQAICYPHGCIDGRLNSGQGVKFVWLGEGRSDPDDVGPWGRKGLHPGDMGKIPGFEEAYDLQKQVMGIWKPATWSGLAAAIRAEIGGPEVEAIAQFLRVGGPSAS